MSLGMFSIIPVPKNSWNDKYMPLVIPSMPVVGLLIGLLWYGAAVLLSKLSVPVLLQSAAILFTPLVLTGFIHTDGFMDTADAVLSRRDLETKKKILKDPNAGAFAVISVIGIILFGFCAMQIIIETQKSPLIFIFIPVISRCTAGVAMLNLKSVFDTGYNAMFKNGTKPSHTVFICLLAASTFLAARLTVLPLLTGALAGILTAAYLYKQFDGISGDLCGCIIVISEVFALLSWGLL